MHIQKIEVSNVLGLSRADIVCSQPVMIIAGNNEAGKSTIADAVSMAILGQPRRVKLKKELGQLLHEGADKGRVTVIADGDVMGEFRLPGGQHKAESVRGAEFLEFVLDPSAFARQTLPDRRSALFALTKCKMSPDVVEAKLIERGIPETMAAEIKPLLRGGFPATCDELKERASQAKGAWKNVTGEQWGSQKAEGWEPELPVRVVDAAELEAAAKEEAEASRDLSDATEALGASKLAARDHAQRAGTIASLEEIAALLQRRQIKLNEDTARADEWQQKVVEAERAASGQRNANHQNCPCCEALLEVKADGTLSAADDHLPDGEDAADLGRRLAEYRGYLESAKRAVANSERDVQASKDAAAKIEALKADSGSVVSEEAIANAEQVVIELRQAHASAQAKVSALRDAQQAIESHAETVKKAAEHHAEVMGWLAAAEALAPDGIPAEILATALTPVNDALAVLSRLSGWKKIEITADMEITCGGRLYGLMSESAKWRADTLLALVIAQISELRLVILDRFDVLDLPGRSQLLNMLVELGNMKAMDSMLMCGTMKALPEKLPAGVAGVWVKNSIAETAQ